MKWIPFECSEEIPEENFTSLKNSYNHCTTNLCRKKKTRNSVATNNIWKFIHATDYEKVLPRGMVNSSCGSSRGEMAATTAVKSPLHTSSLHKPTTSFSCCSKVSFSAVRLPARRRSCSISSSAGETNADVNAIEVRKVADEDLKVSATLPRPLTSAHFSNASTSEGSRLRVAYQGVSGAYSESAAEKAYPNCEAVSCEQFDTAFEAVERWTVDRAVLPIENSLGGSIHRNYDLLLRHRLHIVGEVKLAIRHCLMANHGAKIEDLHRVLSHPQALAQCENTLTKWGLVREAVDDTAGAAQYIAFEGIKDAGAVASETAAKIYGLNILARDIQDDSDNVTRFLMLAREPIIPGVNKPFKTSIVFSLEEGPGVLFKALAVFAMRSINLTKIESRPLQKQALQDLVPSTSGLPKNFPYIFYVDFEASMADQRAQNALGHLKEFAAFLRVLGSYPADNGMP